MALEGRKAHKAALNIRLELFLPTHHLQHHPLHCILWDNSAPALPELSEHSDNTLRHLNISEDLWAQELDWNGPCGSLSIQISP